MFSRGMRTGSKTECVEFCDFYFSCAFIFGQWKNLNFLASPEPLTRDDILSLRTNDSGDEDDLLQITCNWCAQSQYENPHHDVIYHPPISRFFALSTWHWIGCLHCVVTRLPLICKMVATCTCVKYVRCCSCLFNKEQTWTKSLRNFPKCSPTTWSSWLERGGKRNAGEKSYNFFEEGYVYDIYACQQVEDFHVKAHCYRSLRKSAEP